MKFHPVDLNYEYPADNSSALFQQCGIVPAHYPFTRLTWIQPFSKPKILANSVPVVNVPLLHESLERLEISRTKSFPPTTNLPPFHRKCRSFSLSNSPAIHHCSFEFLPPPPPRETSRHRLVMQSREAHLLRAGEFFFFLEQGKYAPTPFRDYFSLLEFRISIRMYILISFMGKVKLNNDEF